MQLFLIIAGAFLTIYSAFELERICKKDNKPTPSEATIEAVKQLAALGAVGFITFLIGVFCF